MADTKITALTAITTVDPAADVLPIVDVSDTSMAASGTTKKITSNQILGAGGTATLASATITGDLTVDTSTLKVDSANNRVGIGTASPATRLEVADANGIPLRFGDIASAPASQTACYVGMSTATLAGATNGDLVLVPRTSGSNSITLWTGNGTASERYRIDGSGVATWSNVGGVAGTAMTLNSTGLGVGVSPQAKIHIANASMLIETLSTQNKPALALGSLGAYYGLIQNDGTGLWSLGYGGSLTSLGTPVLSWTSSGNVGIGMVPANNLSIGSATYASFGVKIDSITQSSLIFKGTPDAAGYEHAKIVSGRESSPFTYGSFLAFYTEGKNSGTTDTSTERLRIDSSGNVISNVTGTAPTLATNSQMVFNLTSNTNLRISVRGTDGTTRTADITLA